MLDYYYLNKEDLTDMADTLGTYGKGKNAYEMLPSNVKSALTRSYNQGTHFMPYASIAMSKRSVGMGSGPLGGDPDMEAEPEDDTAAAEEEDGDSDKDDDVTKDKMIKVKSPAAKRRSSGGASSSKK